MLSLVIAAFVGSGALTYAATASLSFTTTIEGGSLVESASYVVFRDGSTYFAKNGTTGAIDYSGTNATQVIQNAIGTGDKKIFVRAGLYSLISITPKDDLTIEGEGSETTVFLATTTTPVFNHSGILNRVTFTDFKIDCDNTALHGIIGEYKDSLFQRLHIYNLAYEGMWLKTPADLSGILQNRVIECKIRNGGNGTQAYPSYAFRIASTDSMVRRCVVAQYQGAGIGAFGSNILVSEFHAWQVLFGVYVDVPFWRITDSWLEGANYTGIYIEAELGNTTRKGVISNNMIWHNDLDDDGSGVGISFYGGHNPVSDILIIGNWIGDFEGYTATQDYGIRGFGNYSNITITGNHFYNNTQRHIYFDGIYSNITISDNWFSPEPTVGLVYFGGSYSDLYVHHNLGYITENSGTATISSSTSVTVTHGLAGTPTSVIAITNATAAGDVAITSITATQFTVTVVSSGTYAVYWYAEYKP